MVIEGVALEARLEKIEQRIENLERELRSGIKEIKERLSSVERLEEPDSTLNLLRRSIKETGFAMVFAGIIKEAGRETSKWNFSHAMDDYKEYIESVDTEFLREFLGAFMNEERVLILRHLVKNHRPTSANELSEVTGIEGGHLYHHLDQLIKSRYAAKEERGLYSVTGLGETTLFAITTIVQNLKKWKERVKEPNPKEVSFRQ